MTWPLTRWTRTARLRRCVSRTALVFLSSLLVIVLWDAGPLASTAIATMPSGVRAAGLDQAGEQVYRELCAVCHGDSGRGDGPLAFGMRPTVLDLRFHLVEEAHTDEELFSWISDGLPGVPFHTYRGDLTEQERWDVVNFIRASFSN